MSLLTVITPSKNHVEGMRLAAESLAAQSFKDWEHLVIDSASTDGTVEYCLGRPQTTIISEPDNCIEVALTKGLRLAKGKYITFLFCYDSLVDPDWLKKAMDFLESNPDYSMISGTAGSEAYPYEIYPTGPKFSYFFYIASWTVVNETAFVGRASIIREQFPEYKSANHQRDAFFQLWINFFSMGYLVHFLPYQVIKNDTHEGSRIAEEAKSGEFGVKVADFYDQKRATRHNLLRGKFHIHFKGSENQKVPVTYSRFAFTCATLYYKLNLFFIKKILRRKLPATRYGYSLHLGKRCVDLAVRD